MKGFKKIISLVLGLSIFLLPSSVVFASENETVYENRRVINDFWTNPTEHTTVTEIDLGNGFRAVETTTEIFSLTRASGTKYQHTYTYVYDGDLSVTCIYVTGEFSYDGSKATVTYASQTHSSLSSGYSMATFTKAQSDSGTLNDAYVKVNYKVTKQQGGSNVGSGKVEVTCGKNG